MVGAGGPDVPHMLVSQVEAASPQALADMIQDFMTVPGCEVAFDRSESGSDDEIVIKIKKADMEQWLQKLDMVDPRHAPLSPRSNESDSPGSEPGAEKQP